jgi:hypothetical protein
MVIFAVKHWEELFFEETHWEELRSVRYGVRGGDADVTSPWRFIVPNIHMY